MMKRIMTTRAAAVAFAASALFAAPALADPVKKSHKANQTERHASAAVQFDIGDGLSVTLANDNWGLASHNGHYGYGYGNNRYNGYNNRQRLKKLRRRAIRSCSEAVKYAAHQRGFRRVYLEDVERVKQIGPQGFLIRAEFEFEGRRRDFDREITCEVRRGRVVDIDNLPRARGHRGGNDGYHDGYGPRGNDHLKGGNRQNY